MTLTGYTSPCSYITRQAMSFEVNIKLSNHSQDYQIYKWMNVNVCNKTVLFHTPSKISCVLMRLRERERDRSEISNVQAFYRIR